MIKIIREADYRGQHQAPANDGESAPLYDVTMGVYPEDFYTGRASDYGAGELYDREAISIILSYRNRPKGSLKVYRAVPNVNADVDKKIDDLNIILSYYIRFGFYPMDDKISRGSYYLEIRDSLTQAIDHIEDYDESNDAFKQLLYKEIDKLKDQKQGMKGFKIQRGDWVTITKAYAVDHGRSNLNNKFKIVTKTVLAKHLWTDGNSIHEWGYDPQ